MQILWSNSPKSPKNVDFQLVCKNMKTASPKATPFSFGFVWEAAVSPPSPHSPPPQQQPRESRLPTRQSSFASQQLSNNYASRTNAINSHHKRYQISLKLIRFLKPKMADASINSFEWIISIVFCWIIQAINSKYLPKTLSIEIDKEERKRHQRCT